MGFVDRLKDFVGLNNDYEEDDQGYEQTLVTEEFSDTSNTVDLEAHEQLSSQGFPRSSTRRYSAQQFQHDPASSTMSPRNNVIGMPRAFTDAPEVVIMEPRSFEEMPQAIQALREQKTLVLNLCLMDLEQAQRAVDFVAGGTFAIDGHQERVGESIFLFTPNSVKVSSQNGVTHDAPQVHNRGMARPSSPAPQWTMEEAMVS
jgi:cell division inhibitor SepF